MSIKTIRLYSSFRNWLTLSLAGLSLLLFGVIGINYFFDPLWVFNNFPTPYKHEFDERAQKTNLLLHNKIFFDGILLGSSRSTYIPIQDFLGEKIFNYSVAALNPFEYSGFIENAKTIHKGELKTILLGLDFFSYFTASNPNKQAFIYLQESSEPLYAFKQLLSLDSLKYSKKNFSIEELSNERLYDNSYQATTRKRSLFEAQQNIIQSVNLYKQEFYAQKTPLSSYRALFTQLKEGNPSSKFVVFTTPETSALFRVMQEQGMYSQYEEWLRVLVSIFGEIYHFHYINPITLNHEENFYDGHHFYPHIGQAIIDTLICHQSKSPCKANFGLKITKENIDAQLEHLQQLNNHQRVESAF
ncbi:hypothetical protein [Wolinella succinogenes]|uniref:hypothetical protein n=1 Tax=Wolinella succinogenes TaxID=844 RepID=UPI002FCB7A91